MSQQRALLTLSLAAVAACAANLFIDATGAVATAAENALGVNRSAADNAGDLMPVDALGTTQVTAGGAIAAGGSIEVGAGGKAVAHAAGKVVAVALEAAAADGDVIEVFLIPNG